MAGETALVPPASCALVPVPTPVRRVLRDTHDTFTLELEPAEPVAFLPGQFAMLYVFGVGEVPISYSGDPRSRRVVHTTRAVGPVTRAMAKLRRGDVLGVRGPFGRGWPIDQAAGCDVVLVAGGIGLAPLRPVLYAIAARRDDFGRVALLHGARSPVDLLFRRDLERWRAGSGIEVGITVDRGERTWTGNIGVVTELLAQARFDAARTTAMVCGPEIMMRFAASALRARGVPAARVWTSLERNMKCAAGLCGRCQLGDVFVCKDGPVLPWDRAEPLLAVRER